MAVGVLGAGQAQALVVTVNGQQWDVTTFTDAIANASKFQTPANGGMMPWYTGYALDASGWALAQQFANAVNTQLGNQTDDLTNGPYFATSYCATGTVCTNDINDFGIEGLARFSRFNFIDSTVGNDNGYDSHFSPATRWAQATLVNGDVPVPGPLPVFGAAAAFGFSRKLRKRIKGHNAVSTTYTP